MESIVLPEKVVLRLIDSEGNAVRLPNVLFTVRTFATRKNDFNLGPFASDDDGLVTITKNDLLAAAEAHYDSGLMDYVQVENCIPSVVIGPMNAIEIEKALEARTKVWKLLLRGESQRWRSIEDLCDLYRMAANKSISAKPLHTLWDGKVPEYDYAIIVEVK